MPHGIPNGRLQDADTSQASCAYLAGIIDGEGCITVAKQRPRKDGSPRFGVVLSIHSTSIVWLHDLRQRWGGIGSIRCTTKKTERHRVGATWVVAGTFAKAVLAHCLPFIQIKREQALLILNFPLVSKGNRVTPELFQLQRAAKVVATELNFRGIQPCPTC
jgi:hypothetical protein